MLDSGVFDGQVLPESSDGGQSRLRFKQPWCCSAETKEKTQKKKRFWTEALVSALSSAVVG
jgi:hypothetical protein